MVNVPPIVTPPQPMCPSKPLPVIFDACGSKYCLDEESAKSLSANVESLKSCIKQYKLYSMEVENAVKIAQ